MLYLIPIRCWFLTGLGEKSSITIQIYAVYCGFSNWKITCLLFHSGRDDGFFGWKPPLRPLWCVWFATWKQARTRGGEVTGDQSAGPGSPLKAMGGGGRMPHSRWTGGPRKILCAGLHDSILFTNKMCKLARFAGVRGHLLKPVSCHTVVRNGNTRTVGKVCNHLEFCQPPRSYWGATSSSEL